MNLACLSPREKVQIIEDEMRKAPQVHIPVRHYFCEQGTYAREITIPAGTLLTGRIHKYAQINILSSGTIEVLTENGIETVTAPFTVVSPPGTKRIARAVTKCTWTTILATDETDPDKIEDLFTVETEKDYLAFLETQRLERAECHLLPQP